MKKQNVSILIILMVVIIAAIAIYWTSANKGEIQKNDDVVDFKDNQDTKEVDFNLKGTVIYANRLKDKSDIYTYALETKEPKKVFTDADESEKIKNFGGMSNNKALVQMSNSKQEFIGILYNILIDGSGKRESLVPDFASTQGPKISPNGKKITYTLFSNAEADFGFKLIVANSDNTSKFELDNDNSNLIIFSWNPDSSKICYSKGSNENEFKIYIADINDNDKKELTTIQGQVNSIHWGNDDLFVTSVCNKNKSFNDTEIYKFNLEKTKLQQITKNKTYDNYPVLSSDGQNFIYFAANYDKDKTNLYKQGEIFISDINGDHTAKLSEGNYPIGWME